MKIAEPKSGTIDNAEIVSALQALVSFRTPANEAPCPNCEQHIPSRCSVQCDGAASALSTEPKVHPLEAKTVPLVFEMTASGFAQPYWSCEGHLDQEGKLWRLPQVSFYLAHSVYAQLLTKYIAKLESNKRLAYDWHVVVADYGPINGAAYSIEPRLNCVAEPHLGMLQQDMLVLAKDFNSVIKNLASDLLAQM